MKGRPLSLALFVPTVATLVGVAILLTGHEAAEHPSPLPGAPVSTDNPSEDEISAAHLSALRAAYRAPIGAARRFLAAYLDFEVGRLDRETVRRLRATASSTFAAELLAAPPRLPPGHRPPRAVPTYIEATAIPGAAPRLLIHGALRRGGRREPFAFVFERRANRWLAVGVGE